MASKVGLVLALDGEKEFQAGLKAAKGAVTETKAALEAVKKQYDGQADTMSALVAQSEKYTSIQKNLNTQLDMAKAGLANANANYQKINDTIDEHTAKQQTLQSYMASAKRLFGENSEAYQSLAAAETRESDILKQQNIERIKAVTSIENWEAQVRKAETAITTNNSAMKKNAAYIKEAQSAADGCATSIDRFGNTIKSVNDAVANPELAQIKTQYDQYKESVQGVSRAAEQFKSSLSGINGEIAGAKAAVTQANEAYAGQLNTVEALKTKLDALNSVEDALTKKQETLNAALENAVTGENTSTVKLAEYREEISKTVQFMDALKEAGMEGSEEWRQQAEVLAQLKRQEQEEFATKQKYAQMQGQLNQELAKTEAEMVTTGTAIAQTSQYWSEAVLSAHGVSESIDKMGNAVKQTNPELEKARTDFAAYKQSMDQISESSQEYATKLAQVNSAHSQAKSALAGVKSEFDGQLNTISALEAKETALADVAGTLKDKQSTLAAAIQDAKEASAVAASSMDDYREKVAQAESKLEELARTQGKSSDEYKDQAKVVEELKSAYSSATTDANRYAQSQAKLESELAKTDSELKDNANETKKTAQYLEEARGSADGCATSINRFGRALNDTEGDLQSFGSILEDKLMAQFTKEKLFDLAADGLRRVGQAAVDAVKNMVSVGMEYNAQMSKVQAITQASDIEMSILSEKAQTLGRTTVYTATQAGEAMQELSLAGWRTSDILTGVDGVLDLASASSMDLATAATYVSDNLNAFQKPASEATRLADIMAYAMSNSSMTTEDLGEAYGKVAATAAAYGYAETEVTAVLMNMANAGRKGGEAGTSLNTIMTRLSTNTSKCAEKIAEYNNGVDIMYDANTGKMRPLTDVLSDLYGVWSKLDDQQRNSLAKSIAGVRQGNALYSVMAGMETVAGSTARSFAEYATELDNCSGAAKQMADVSLNNLSGDVELLNDAMSGLAISTEGMLDSSFRTVVQGITDAINAITETIDPPKSKLEEMIKDLQNYASETDRLLQNSADAMSGATTDIGTIEAYRDVLLDLNQQESLTELQKYEMASAVSKLAGVVPGLSDAFNAETYALSLTNEELEEMFNNAENLAMQQALINANRTTYQGLAEATLGLAVADEAARIAQEELDKAMKDNEFGGMEQGVADATDKLNQAKAEQQKFQDQIEEANDQIKLQDDAFKDLKESCGMTSDSISEMASNEDDLISTTEDAVDTLNDLGYVSLPEMMGFSDEQVAAIEANAEDIAKAYAKMDEEVSKSIGNSINMMKEWSSGDTISISEMKTNLEGQVAGLQSWQDDMITLAGQVGTDFTQEMYDKLVELGPSAAAQIATIADAARAESDGVSSEFSEWAKEWGKALEIDDDATTTAIELATSQGRAVMEAYAAGVDLGIDGFDADAISEALVECFTKAGTEAEDSGKVVGEQGMSGVESGVNANSGKVLASTQDAIDAAASGADTSGMYSVGMYVAEGMAQGINDYAHVAIEAATAMANAVTGASQGALTIQSPSKVFRDEVGKYVALGFALGIKDNAHVAASEASKMSQQVYTASVKWLKQYKKSNKTTLADEEYYWTQVIKHIDNQTSAYTQALKKLQDVRKKIDKSTNLTALGFTDKQTKDITTKIKDMFNVDKYTGSGNSKKKKEAETYYKDVYSAAQKYAKNQQILNDWSDSQELAYWKKVKARLKKGTQAWYDATKTIKDLQEQIKEDRTQAAADQRAATRTAQDKILDYYKTYKKVSLKAEMDYWNAARHQLAANTDEHIEADKNYVAAREAYYDALTELDENYKEDYKDIVDDLEDTVKELDETYKDAVKSRREEIMSSMSLFEAFDTEGYSGEKLIENLQTQVEALALWEETLASLKKRGISDELYQDLLGQGVDGAANVHAINQMTDAQLKQYQELYNAKYQLANMQATEDNKDLLSDTNTKIKKAQDDALDALTTLNQKYSDNLKEITGELSTDLANMLAKAPEVAEESISALFSKYSTENVSKYNTQGVTNKIDSEYAKLKTKSESAGTDAVKGLMKGLQNKGIITSGAKTTVDMITKALKDAAEIHSPSKVMEREIGNYLGEGIAEGLEATESTTAAAEDVITNMLNAARAQMEKQERSLQYLTSGMSSGSNAMINDLVGSYAPQTVVNVDNSATAAQIAQLSTSINDMLIVVSNMKVVLDSGETVGALSGKIDTGLASELRKKNRGSLR